MIQDNTVSDSCQKKKIFYLQYPKMQFYYEIKAVCNNL